MVGTDAGKITLVKRWRSLAPITRAVVVSSWSTPLMPASVLISTMKNTRLMANHTFDVGPMPNQRMNSGASATRGMALNADRYGEKTLSTSGNRAEQHPDEHAGHRARGEAGQRRAQGHPSVSPDVARTEVLLQRLPHLRRSAHEELVHPAARHRQRPQADEPDEDADPQHPDEQVAWGQLGGERLAHAARHRAPA